MTHVHIEETADHGPSIALVDSELARGFRRLRFQNGLEHRYELDITAAQKRHLFSASLIGLVLYDLFLLNDWRMIPDVFGTALIFRLGILTPLALFGIVSLSRWSLKFFERYASFIAILSVVLLMGLFTLSNSVFTPHYQYGSVMIVIFAAIVQRLRVRYLAVVMLAIAATQFVATYRSATLDSTVFQAAFFMNVTVAVLVLFAAYGLEHERRRSYLLSIRSRLMNDALDRAAKIDPLTGLWNRRYLNATLETAWSDINANHCAMTVILLDIDHFKIFNDTYGHMEGDRCLQRIGARLRTALDDIANVAVRFGGEEFLVFLPGVEATEGHRAARILRQTIHDEAILFYALGEGMIVTASIGVATGLVSEISSHALVAAADAALYEAKRAGRDCIVPHEAERPAHSPRTVAAA